MLELNYRAAARTINRARDDAPGAAQRARILPHQVNSSMRSASIVQRTPALSLNNLHKCAVRNESLNFGK